MEEETDYIKLDKNSPLYLAIIEYMKKRAELSILYMSANHANLLLTDREAYNKELIAFYESYPKFTFSL